jgi:hypothetical protein
VSDQPEGLKQLATPKGIAMIVLLLVAVGFVVYQLMPATGGTSTGTSAARPSGQTQQADARRLKEVDIDADDLLSKVRAVTFNYAERRIERQPMRPLVGRVQPGAINVAQQPGTASSVLRKSITAIMIAGDATSAIVDNEVVYVGYVYPDGVQVQEIQPGRVIFKVGDSLIPVEMKEL